jgi:hypothetical protein
VDGFSWHKGTITDSQHGTIRGYAQTLGLDAAGLNQMTLETTGRETDIDSLSEEEAARLLLAMYQQIRSDY